MIAAALPWSPEATPPIRDDTPLVVLSPSMILAEAASAFGVRSEDLTGRCLSRRLTQLRQVAMYVVRLRCHLSYPEIARVFRRDHTTVIYACRRVEANPELISIARRVIAALDCSTGGSFT